MISDENFTSAQIQEATASIGKMFLTFIQEGPPQEVKVVEEAVYGWFQKYKTFENGEIIQKPFQTIEGGKV